MGAQMVDLSGNVAAVRRRIEAACQRVGRSSDEVTIVAVSKTRSPAEIEAAYACGLRHFGENRIEEAEAKIPEVTRRLGDGITWHMVGHIQSRKAGRVAQLADVVHSVDSVKLAQRLDRAAAEADRILPVLLECNVSGEASKYGFDAATGQAGSGLGETVREILACGHLRLRGLMTMAPIADDPETVRPVFARLRALRDALQEGMPGLVLPELSMGMTDDFEVAVEEGATVVRIGRAIFGPAVY